MRGFYNPFNSFQLFQKKLTPGTILLIKKWDFEGRAEPKTRRFVILNGWNGITLLASSVQGDPIRSQMDFFYPISRYEHDDLTKDSFVDCMKIYEFDEKRLSSFLSESRLECDGSVIDRASLVDIGRKVLAAVTVEDKHKVEIARVLGIDFTPDP